MPEILVLSGVTSARTEASSVDCVDRPPTHEFHRVVMRTTIPTASSKTAMGITRARSFARRRLPARGRSLVCGCAGNGGLSAAGAAGLSATGASGTIFILHQWPFQSQPAPSSRQGLLAGIGGWRRPAPTAPGGHPATMRPSEYSGSWSRATSLAPPPGPTASQARDSARLPGYVADVSPQPQPGPPLPALRAAFDQQHGVSQPAHAAFDPSRRLPN